MKKLYSGLLRATLLAGLYLPAVTQGDAQQFWLTTSSFPGGPKTGITLVDDTCLFAGLQTGVIRSCDDAHRFDAVLSAPAVFTVFSTRPGKVLAGGAGKIYVSADMGENWDSVQLNSVYPLTQFVEDPDGGLYAISGTLDLEEGLVGDGVFYSADGGLSWDQRINGLGSYKSAERIAVDQNGRIYLAVADEYTTGKGGLYLSRDKGLHWVKIDLTLEENGMASSPIKISHTTGLSISSDGMVYHSFYGVLRNALVQLNLRKPVDQIDNEGQYWQSMQVFHSVAPWLDRPLNNIHFTDRGQLLSSFSGSLNTGGTYYSAAEGQRWTRVDYGLGLDQFNRRNMQCFTEKQNGQIYMVQFLDERIYQVNTDQITSVDEPGYPPLGIRLYPNPVHPQQMINLQVRETPSPYQVHIFDTNGRSIVVKKANTSEIEIEAPEIPGDYWVRVTSGLREKTFPLVVQ